MTTDKKRIRLTRFCSQAEFDKFSRGDTMLNHTDHYRCGKGGSTSYGFCFSIDEPKVAWRYLKGIVDCDVCMVVEVDKGKLIESKGKYYDHIKGCPMLKTEYCMTMYSKDDVELIKVVPMNTLESHETLKMIRMFRASRKALKD